MHKPAPADFPITDLLAHRWSPRGFSDRAVDEKSIRSLLEAARWAPSCFNEQPWYFIVATKDHPEEFARMLACLAGANQAWAKHAPVLMISVAADNWKRDGKPNRHAQHDTGIASAMLSIQATAMGMQVHMMGGFDPEKACTTYNIPDGFTSMAAFAIGYPGDPAMLPEELRRRETAPRSRKPQSEFVFSGNWGETMK
jgi:nitroreductase